MSAGLQPKWDLIHRKKRSWDVSITKELQGKACLWGWGRSPRCLRGALMITVFPAGLSSTLKMWGLSEPYHMPWVPFHCSRRAGGVSELRLDTPDWAGDRLCTRQDIPSWPSRQSYLHAHFEDEETKGHRGKSPRSWNSIGLENPGLLPERLFSGQTLFFSFFFFDAISLFTNVSRMLSSRVWSF